MGHNDHICPACGVAESEWARLRAEIERLTAIIQEVHRLAPEHSEVRLLTLLPEESDNENPPQTI